MSQTVIQKSLLVEKIRERDIALGLHESTLKIRCTKLSHLLRYMDSKSINLYSPDVGYDFLESFCSNESATSYAKRKMKYLVYIANNICEGKPFITKRTFINHSMFGPMSVIAEDYIRYATDVKRLSMMTIKRYRYIISLFTQKMSLQQINWDTLKYSHILDFLSSRNNTEPILYACIRNLLHFAYLSGATSEDLSLLFLSVKPHRKEKLPSCYTPEEVALVEESVDRRSNVGKRDYAIILLASRLGMRSSDIRRLEFKNLDWDKSEIRIIQYKTNKTLILPLLADIGDAIIDYVMNARPKSNLKTIFLTCNHPYKLCESATISTIVNRYFIKSHVDFKGKHSGSHALRHSLATAMLSEGSPLQVISGILGHQSSESTMYYLGIDIKSLLPYALYVPPVDESFYLQKGGMLYE